MYTIKQAAKELPVSSTTLRRWIKEGKIKSLKNSEGHIVFDGILMDKLRQMTGGVKLPEGFGEVDEALDSALEELFNLISRKPSFWDRNKDIIKGIILHSVLFMMMLFAAVEMFNYIY